MPDPMPVNFDDPTTTAPQTATESQPPAYEPDGTPPVTYAFDDPENPEFVTGEKIGIVAGGTILAALVAGFVYHLVAQHYDSFGYVPALAGALAGALLLIAFRRAKLAAKIPVIVCGIAVGVLTYALRYEFTALADRPYLVEAQTLKRKAENPDRDESAIRADIEHEITPLNVVPVYLDVVGEHGVTVSGRGAPKVLRGSDYQWRVYYSTVFCIIGSFCTLNGVLRPKKEIE